MKYMFLKRASLLHMTLDLSFFTLNFSNIITLHIYIFKKYLLFADKSKDWKRRAYLLWILHEVNTYNYAQTYTYTVDQVCSQYINEISQDCLVIYMI